MRKTCNVEELLKFANKQLERTDEIAITPGFKEGICTFIEKILHQSNRYKGFQYLFWLKEGCDLYTKDPRDKKEIEDFDKKFLYGNLGPFARIYY